MEIKSRDGAYLFQTLEDLNCVGGTSQILSLNDSGEYDYGCGEACLYGRMRAIFGEPVYETDDFENLFSYVVRCIKDGEETLIHLYHGPTGSAAGGNHDTKSMEAAAALQELILQAEPADYELEGYYFDGPTHIRCGVKDGKPFWEEEALSEEEVLKLYQERYED